MSVSDSNGDGTAAPPGGGAALPDLETMLVRRETLTERIRAAGGDPDSVEIVAVTKRFPVEAVELAVQAGFCSVGENYAQELIEKAALFEDRNGPGSVTPSWHMIGGLQRNKVKKLVGVGPVFQTIDRLDLVGEVAKRMPRATVFVQVNATDEPQKSGCSVAETPSLVDACGEAGLDLVGLMTVGPTDGSDPTGAFVTVRQLVDDHGLSQCSMGMSGDLEKAVGAGTTMIRVGSALFGPRPTTI